jgi:hypothetical protein
VSLRTIYLADSPAVVRPDTALSVRYLTALAAPD